MRTAPGPMSRMLRELGGSRICPAQQHVETKKLYFRALDFDKTVHREGEVLAAEVHTLLFVALSFKLVLL